MYSKKAAATDILIIGGGLAGLAAARTLAGKKNYLLIEKEAGIGGLAASVKKNGFTFDYSGHLLHLHWKETGDLILGLLKNNNFKLKRNAWIHLAGVEVPYPFQANLYNLPDKIKSECVGGFLAAYKKTFQPSALSPQPEVFARWSRRIFGEGISKYFMLPYNAKLWQYPLDRLTADWCAPFVPMPRPQEVLEAAYLPKRTAMGYNPVFYYPKTGGIQALPAALAAGLKNIHTGCELESLDLSGRTARIRGLGTVKYKHLINTMPLKYFVELIKPPKAALCANSSRLRHNAVYVLNLGVKGTPSGKHWTYFPESEFLFYRAGIATNFSRRLAPEGCSSLYIETATPGGPLDTAAAEKKIFRGLLKSGVLKSENEIVEKLWLKIPCAYVIHDAARSVSLPAILSTLSKNGVSSIGRYGAWKYSFMEESIKEGIETAKKIAASGE
ncbi:MAG: FAD-dependent oxidoreductase [Elusimicrobiales bacterium]|jgi:protoporphyrinogen oxidase